MALIKLDIKPGIISDRTNYSNEGHWVDCDKVRFVAGLPQKMGGWQRYSTGQVKGVCRGMFNWSTTYADQLLAIGTDKKAYIMAESQLYDVTPIRATFTSSVTDNSLTLTDGSNIVQVTLTAHGADVGDYLRIAGVEGVNHNDTELYGIPLPDFHRDHEVVGILGPDDFTIEMNYAADLQGTPTIGGLGGTDITMVFDIPSGSSTTLSGYGWGVGTWSRERWGTPADYSSDAMTELYLREWWFDRFNNDLIGNIRGGPIYYWERGGYPQTIDALDVPMGLLSGRSGAESVPEKVGHILLSQTDGHLIAFGATPFGGGDFDPLLIRWASQGQPEVWTPAPTNSAGFLRIFRGIRIVRAVSTRQEILVWTDTSLHALQFLGSDDVFGLQVYADNVSIMSARGVITANDVTYWMGVGQFYLYNGRVEPIPCPVSDRVFQDLNLAQADQVHAVTNGRFHEIWWFYPSKDSPTIDRYVVFNYLENLWYYGSMDRTACLDNSLSGSLLGISKDGVIYNHEVGVDDDSNPMESYIQSADMALGSGDEYLLTRRILPDLTFVGSSIPDPEVKLVVRPRNFPGNDYIEDPADQERVVASTIDRYTEQVFIRARARQMALRLESSRRGTNWRLGTPRVDASSSGRK